MYLRGTQRQGYYLCHEVSEDSKHRHRWLIRRTPKRTLLAESEGGLQNVKNFQ